MDFLSDCLWLYRHGVLKGNPRARKDQYGIVFHRMPSLATHPAGTKQTTSNAGHANQGVPLRLWRLSFSHILGQKFLARKQERYQGRGSISGISVSPSK